MFRQLCGDGALKNVCITTTNWDRVTKEEGDMREQELRGSLNLFKPLINEGAQLVRHDKAIASARSIINYLIHKDPTKLKTQVELDEGKKLEETEAGSVLKEEVKASLEKLEGRLRVLKEEMEEAERKKHAELLAELEEERQKWKAQMKKLENDLENLKTQAQSDKAKIRNLEDKIAANEKQKQRDKDNQPGADLPALNKRMVRAKKEPTNQAEPVERKSLPEKLAREPEPRKGESKAPRAEQKPMNQAEPVKRKSLPEKLAREPEPRKGESETPRAEQKTTNQAEPGLVSKFISTITWGLFSW
jgi:chromosome segregation ATPase